METAEIVARLRRFTGEFEREAVEAAVAQQDEIVPALLQILEDVAERPAEIADDIDSMAQIYAMYLLAQFRETGAYPLMVRIALLPGDLLDELLGDFVTESLGQAVASVCGGEVGGIQSIIESADADEWARSAALGSLVTLVAAGVVPRHEVLSYFTSLFHGKLADKNEVVWSDLVISSTDLGFAQLLPEIERAYQDDLVDPGIVGLREVRRDLDQGEEWALARLAADPRCHLIVDTVSEMEWWSCFHEDEEAGHHDAEDPDALAGFSAMDDFDPEDEDDLDEFEPWVGLPEPGWITSTSEPYRRPEPKVGRNEPCPCGSGKKYKKCCGS
ncbi:MAG TPA: DUF1186 domain-containing protein [Terracidiphilus sp.]|jgi:hypothetical protein|nr:DUF1186 domain-containing protein [Terracidiphilus sp.]